MKSFLKRLREGDTSAISFLLFALVVLTFLPSIRDDFINYDDDLYVYENARVQGPLNWGAICWAFTTLEAGFWQPLTWITVLLDFQLFGLRPAGHHLTSILFHAANTVLLFVVLRRMTGAVWLSAFVAALFAAHPLHVEPVAWVSDRKDVLAAFFWILALLMYARYSRNRSELPSTRLLVFDHLLDLNYLWTLGFFVCGLMSKGTVLTLPMVLLLLDWWPLQRLRRSNFLGLLWEKLPFFGVGLISGLISLYGQKSIGALPGLAQFTAGERFANALLSNAHYLSQTLWPFGLAAHYPFPRTIAIGAVVGAALLGILLSALALGMARKRPYLFVGWLWYVVTLLPAIQLIQVGGQARADRYVYLPLIGLFLLLAWGANELSRRWPFRAISLSVAGSVVLLTCFALTRFQIAYWKDSTTLYRHALEVTRDNYLAHNNLGAALLKKERVEEAMTHLQTAIGIRPQYAEAHCNLAVALEKQGWTDEAIVHFNEALRLAPGDVHPHVGLGAALLNQGQLDEAVGHLTEALRITPRDPGAHYALGIALLTKGQSEEGIARLEEALKLKPKFADARCKLGIALGNQGRLEEAADQLNRAIALMPEDAGFHFNLAVTLGKQGRLDAAISEFQQALRLNPAAAEAHCGLGTAFYRQGRADQAMKEWQAALRLNPHFADTHYHMGVALSNEGILDEAILHLQEALRLKPGHTNAQRSLRDALAKKTATPSSAK